MSKKANEGNLKNTVINKPKAAINVQSVVRGINQRMAKVDEGSIGTGEFILDEVFQGSLNDALSRNPYKDKSMKQICDDPKLLVDRRVLASCVKAAFLRRTLLAVKVDCSKLRYSHFVALLKVTDEKKRRDLAVKANRGSWSVRQLIEKIDAAKQSANTVGKAKRLVKKVEDPLALLKDEETKKLFQNPEELRRQLNTADRLLIANAIDAIVAKLATSTDILKRARKNIAQIELGDMDAAA
jgi:hypothetical protein